MIFNYRRLKTCHDARELYVWASTFLSHLKLASQNSNKQFWEISESLHWRMHNFCLLAFPSIVEPVKCSVFTLYVLALGSALVEHLAINMIPSLKIWCAKSLRSCLTLWPYGLQPSRLLCPWDFSRQEYWSGFLPDPGIKLVSLLSSALAGGFFTTSTTWRAQRSDSQVFIIQRKK